MRVSIVFYYFFKWFKFTLKIERIPEYAGNVHFTFSTGSVSNNFEADLDSNQNSSGPESRNICSLSERLRKRPLRTKLYIHVCRRDLMSVGRVRLGYSGIYSGHSSPGPWEHNSRNGNPGIPEWEIIAPKQTHYYSHYYSHYSNYSYSGLIPN